MVFKGTSTYKTSLAALLKKYPTIKQDIRNEFHGLSFEEIFHKKYVLKDSGNHKILKIRIANSSQNKGKSSGFRLIAVLDKNKALIVFINIYPKAGADGKDNLSKEELKSSLYVYKKEVSLNTLKELTLLNKFL